MSSPWYQDPNDENKLLFEQYEMSELDVESGEQRFVDLLPCNGDKEDENNHVRCVIHKLKPSEAGPYVAIRNARGYRLMQDAIEIDGKMALISQALQVFLRQFRRRNRTIRLWTRHLCLRPSDEEKERYWTRPFVESMYNSATEVVDMSVYNSDLLDHNVVQYYVDSEFTSWRKEWTFTEQNNAGSQPLPMVYPIWLGMKGSDTDPSEKFRYVPLDRVAAEIRLVIIDSIPEGGDQSSPLRLYLAHQPLHSGIRFLALSYTWGKFEPGYDVILAGQRMEVQPNLWRALKAIRQPHVSMCIWVDALCIDQTNIVERNQQIPRMGAIYDKAEGVISNIGEELETDGDALRLVNAIKDEPMMRIEADKWLLRDKEITDEQLPSLCAALVRCADRPYFRRAWVLQEIANATEPIIVIGADSDKMLFWDNLDRALYNLESMLRSDFDLRERVALLLPDIENPYRSLAHARLLFYLRRVNIGAEWDGGLTPPPPIKADSPAFLDVAILARDREATDSKDKIFSLASLVKDGDDMRQILDYRHTIEEVFVSFTVAWAKHHGRLDAIGPSEYSCDPKNAFYRNAPSWCTDWSTPSTVHPLVRRDKLPNEAISAIFDQSGMLYSADGNIKQHDYDTWFRFEDHALLCTGVILDTISLPEPDDYLGMAMRDIGFIMQSGYESEGHCHYANFSQAFWAMLHGDSAQAWPARDKSNDDTDAMYQDEEWTAMPFDRWQLRSEPPPPHEARHIARYADNYSRKDAIEVFQMVTRGRFPALTSGGYLCLFPKDSGDMKDHGPLHLGIIACCSVPVIIQEVHDRPGTYKLLGTCFVQGWMDGEMVTEFMGTDSAEEFWETLRDSERIRII